MEFILSRICSGLMIIFPSFSHSQAAANEPRMLEITKDFVEIIDKVAYDSIASPVPVVSTTLFANDGSVKAGVFGSSFLTETIPLSPNFKVHVVGDTIIDSYTRTNLIGGNTKTPTTSVLYQEKKDYIGGAGIVAQHLKNAGAKVFFI